MREILAERLLAKVMAWPQERVAVERPILQSLAAYKYDEYQQFSPGMHFVESLAHWMDHFQTVGEREVAYRFVMQRLVFISEAETRYLVSSAYPDVIRPALLSATATDMGIPPYMLAKIAASDDFRTRQRRSLFLGLSDGARIDRLRRYSSLNNEQIHSSYHLSDEKCQDMLRELSASVENSEGEATNFNTVFLVDDFAGSGHSLLREEDGKAKGKLAKALRLVLEASERTGLLAKTNVQVYLVIYLTTVRALETLEARTPLLGKEGLPIPTILPVYVLPKTIDVNAAQEPEFNDLLIRYYDPTIMDRHLEKGGDDVIHGYANCALPLVLTHNTPNNSVYLLWAEKRGLRTSALFPRVSRHKDEN